jgi:hypothetical protein
MDDQPVEAPAPLIPVIVVPTPVGKPTFLGWIGSHFRAFANSLADQASNGELDSVVRLWVAGGSVSAALAETLRAISPSIMAATGKTFSPLVGMALTMIGAYFHLRARMRDHTDANGRQVKTSVVLTPAEVIEAPVVSLSDQAHEQL